MQDKKAQFAFKNNLNLHHLRGGGGHSGADLNVLCKHFKKFKYNNLGSNCHFVDVKFKETF